MELNRPKLSNGKIVQYSLADIARGIFTGMIGSYLLYFYQPDVEKSGLPELLPFAGVMAILTVISKIFDILSEPIVAKYTDRCNSKYGRRMPFLRWTAIPCALSILLIFFAPFKEKSVGNAIWVCVFLIAYYFCYTLYFLPQKSLVPEVIQEPNKRVAFYSLSTTCFIAGTCLIYLTTLFVKAFVKAGLSTLTAWRCVFGIFAGIGLIFLLLSAFAFNEKKYVFSVSPSNESLLQSFSIVLKNKSFIMFSLSDLFSHTALACFQTGIMYYITTLLEIDQSLSYIVMISQFLIALACFPIMTKLSEKLSKKTLIISANVVFIVLFILMFFGNNFAQMLDDKHKIILGIVMGIIEAYPFAAIHVMPQSMLSDIIQADSIKSGINREGAFSAVRDFMEKLAHTLAMVIISSFTLIGGDGKGITLIGVKSTTIVALVLCAVSVVLYALYQDREVNEIIKSHMTNEKETKEEEPIKTSLE